MVGYCRGVGGDSSCGTGSRARWQRSAGPRCSGLNKFNWVAQHVKCFAREQVHQARSRGCTAQDHTGAPHRVTQMHWTDS
eukprot:365881-Chlamydomonas_euryale.AAC.7